MSTPSVLLIPDLLKAGKLYSQIPNSGAVDFDVTRATTAFRTNASGILESVASGVPRLDYPIGGGCPSLLVEPAATNLFLRSEEFDNGIWGKGGAGTGLAPVVTADAALAPNGTMTADLIVFDRGAGNTSGDRSDLTQAPAVVAATTYSSSLYLKAATIADVGKQIAIRGVDQGSFVVITLTSEWVRYNRAAVALNTSGVFTLRNQGALTNSNSVSVHAWGAQLEVGSVATSYIPTVAATATRNADVISKTGVSGFIGQAEGTLYAEVDTRITAGTALKRIISLNDGTSTNEIFIAKTVNDALFCSIVALGVGQASFQTSNSQSGIFKIAIGYKLNDVAAFINGVQVGATDTSATIPATSIFDLGNTRNGIAVFNDRIRAAAIYPTRLTNAQLASLTTL